MMAQIRDAGDGIRDGTYTMTAPKITGGTITGVTLTGNTFSNPVVTGVSTFAAGTVSAPAITTTGDTNTGIFFPAADTIAFTEGGAEAMRIDSSGNVLVGITSARSNAGDVQVSKGISFPATQSAQSDANTLDDYEEGTWTATDASGAGLSLSGTTQRYTKVGRLVTILIDNIGFPSTANGSSTSIGGLPFVAAAAVASGGISNYTTSTVQFFIAAGESNIRLYNMPSLFTRTTNAQMSTNSFYTSITYSV
jgi:hypothetical protein